jgi:hypothetical protein
MPTNYTTSGVLGQDEGTDIGFGAILNFTGAGVTASSSGGVITVDIPGGGGGGDHAALLNLPFTSSGHTGAATSVAAFDAVGAAQTVQATADETMLVRRAGILQWVPIAVAALSFSGLTGSTPGDLSLGTVTITTGVFA